MEDSHGQVLGVEEILKAIPIIGPVLPLASTATNQRKDCPGGVTWSG